MDLTDPQQLHGYTYGNNNPVALADPSGLAYEECSTGQYTCRIGGGGGVIDVTPNPDWDGDGSGGGGGGGGDQTDGGSADNAGDPGPATDGPTAEEIARAKAIQDKTVMDVAVELGFEAIKDIIGYNDLMGCVNDRDAWACTNLVVGLVPWGKVFAVVKVVTAIVVGAIAFYKAYKGAKAVLKVAKAARAARVARDTQRSAALARFENAAQTRAEPNATVRDLKSLTEGNASEGPKARSAASRSDEELLDSVFQPKDGVHMSKYPGSNELGDGNHRRNELMRRADDPGSSITWETPIYIRETS